MPKYTANAYLLHKGKIVKDGEEVDLTEEQAKRLGEKVIPSKFSKEETEAPKQLEDYTVPELKEFAEQQGIEGYSELKKDELIQALEG